MLVTTTYNANRYARATIYGATNNNGVMLQVSTPLNEIATGTLSSGVFVRKGMRVKCAVSTGGTVSYKPMC